MAQNAEQAGELKKYVHESLELDRILLFELDGQKFGVPLLQIREIIEVQDPKPVPNTSQHFLGVINIRGQVIGVVDLRLKMGLTGEPGPFNAYVIFEVNEKDTLAVLVDRVLSVTMLPQESIDEPLFSGESEMQEHLIGIARTDLGLVNIIDLCLLMSNDNLVQVNAKHAV